MAPRQNGAAPARADDASLGQMPPGFRSSVLFSLQCEVLAPGIRVYAFEPDPLTAATLHGNIRANNLQERIQVHEVAILDYSGMVRLRGGAEIASGHQSTVSAGSGPAVACMTLGQAMQRIGARRIDLLKIDTEGAECAIVDGTDAAVWDMVHRVALEYHDLGDSRSLVASLEKLRFRCRVYPNSDFSHLGIIQATREYPASLARLGANRAEGISTDEASERNGTAWSTMRFLTRARFVCTPYMRRSAKNNLARYRKARRVLLAGQGRICSRFLFL